jgi:RHS repeat-associated protein
VTDYVDASGTIQAHYEYSPFGKIAAKSGPMDDDFEYRFSSEYLDSETGLVYYGYRYYDANMGRWINRDPAEEGLGGQNLYAFVSNNPMSRWDVLGLWGSSYHKQCTSGAVGLEWASLDDKYQHLKTFKKIIGILEDANVAVDGSIYLLYFDAQDHGYHYTRPADSKDSGVLKYRNEFIEAQNNEIDNFDKELGKEASISSCTAALEALGTVSHTWQDYYAHAVEKSGDTKENIGYLRGNPGAPAMKPVSFSYIPGFGEHPKLSFKMEPGDRAPDASSRRTNAQNYTRMKYREYLIRAWLPKCWCVFRYGEKK